MSKTNEELNKLKEEVENESRKPHELTEEDLEQVTGGRSILLSVTLDGAASVRLNEAV